MATSRDDELHMRAWQERRDGETRAMLGTAPHADTNHDLVLAESGLSLVRIFASRAEQLALDVEHLTDMLRKHARSHGCDAVECTRALAGLRQAAIGITHAKVRTAAMLELRKIAVAAMREEAKP